MVGTPGQARNEETSNGERERNEEREAGFAEPSAAETVLSGEENLNG